MISQANMVKNIVTAFERATPTILEDGFGWYSTGNALIVDIADYSGYGVEHVATAMAHLSPRIHWARNVLACHMVCQGGEKPSGVMGRSWDMAHSALFADSPLDTLNGPKVKRFAANLLLNLDVVTIDTWALKIACGDRANEVNLNHKGVYEKIERAYQKAAAKLGIEPGNCQAVTWCAARGRAN